jgi:hypothetical protein
VTGYTSGAGAAVSGITLGGSADNFAQVVSAVGGNNTNGAFIWADINAAAGQTAVVVTGNASLSGNIDGVAYYEVSGINASDQVNSAAGTSATWSSGATPTTTHAAEFWVGCDRSFTNISPLPSGWTNQQVNVGDVFGYQIVSSEAAATYNGGNSSTSAAWSAAVATFYGAPASGPAVYPLKEPVRATRPLPPRGRIMSSPGAPVSNPTPGPVFRQVTSAIAAKLPKGLLFPRGRVSSNPGARVQNPGANTGPVFHPANSPVRAHIVQPPRGRITSSPGAPVKNPGKGPVFRQFTRAVGNAFRAPGPFRKGSVQSNPGGPYVAPPLPPVPIFTLGNPSFQWLFSPQRASISHLATAPVIAPVAVTKAGIPYDPTGDTVQLAFMAQTTQVPQSSDWVTGTWVSEPSNVLYPQSAQCLIGTGGSITLGIGRYVVYCKISDDPETPVAIVGFLSVQ